MSSAPINWELSSNQKKFRFGAVSYLNTVPLVWGMLNGPQREQVHLSFSIPSVCAQEVESGTIDVGLVPVAEIARQHLEIVPGVGIAATGAVRSILLFSKVPWRSVSTLAADESSRTSVELAKIILRERFGVTPRLFRAAPDLTAMLETADAALIIGDPALLIDPEQQAFPYLDLAEEWFALTRLPFVFAAWAAKPGLPLGSLRKLTTDSYAFGNAQLEQIINVEFSKRQISRELAGRYLRQHIQFKLGRSHLQGLETFLSMAGLNQEVVGAVL